MKPIDIHAHYYPEAYLRLVEQEGPRFGMRIDRSDPKGLILRWGDGARIGPLRSSFTDLAARRREMDRLGVQVHALSLTLPMVDWADGELGLRLARANNDAIAEAHAGAPDRFVGLAALPLQDPPRALQELERVARLPAFRGVYLGTNIAGRDLAQEAFIPVYERIQELRWPLFLHPYNTLGGSRLAPFYLHNLLGNPFDTATAAAHLVFGGVLDRLPRLSICLPHGGGAWPFLAGRLARGWKKVAACRVVKRSPLAYLRRFTYDTITHHDPTLRFLIQLVGARHVMLGSDYCFDLGYDRPVEVVTRLKGLTKTDRAQILAGNARRLLRLA